MYGSKVVELSDDEILSRVTCVDIFAYYIGKDFRLGRAICSPLRKDKSPSFTIFKHNSGKHFFKDFSTGESGDCFTFLTKIFESASEISVLKIQSFKKTKPPIMVPL